MPRLKLHDTELHYELAGTSGPPVLLVQGVGVTGEAWRRQVDTLSQSCRTLIFDNRGIGRSCPCSGDISIQSMARDARALMDEAGWDCAHLVGHSMGGLIVQQMAVDAPQCVRSLSLICTFSRGKDAAKLTLPVLWKGLRTRLGTRAMRRNAFLEILYSPALLRAADRAALAGETARLIGRDLADSPPILMRQLRACSRHDLRARLSEIRHAPTLVVSAEFDPVALPAYGRDLAAAIPAAEFVLQRGMAHGQLLEQPEWLNERLMRHFAWA